MSITIEQKTNRMEGEPLGPMLLPLPLFRGGFVDSLRGDQLIIGRLDGDAHCGLIALTCTDIAVDTAMHIGVGAQELRHMAAEMCRIADDLDAGKGKQ